MSKLLRSRSHNVEARLSALAAIQHSNNYANMLTAGVPVGVSQNADNVASWEDFKTCLFKADDQIKSIPYGCFTWK